MAGWLAGIGELDGPEFDSVYLSQQDAASFCFFVFDSIPRIKVTKCEMLKRLYKYAQRLAYSAAHFQSGFCFDSISANLKHKYTYISRQHRASQRIAFRQIF